MQTPKARNSPSDVPQRVSPRAVRQLKITVEPDSATSSNQTSRAPKERSPKVVERKTPRSPVSEAQKKRPSRLSELERQLSQLQEDLKKAKDQLTSSESCKKQAQQDAEDSKQQLLAMSSKFEESRQQLQDLTASEEARVTELQKISEEREQAWQSELEAVRKQHSVDSAALASTMSEIQRLKVQLETVPKSDAPLTKEEESTDSELQSLKENLAETLSVVEDMKNQLTNCKESEARAQALVSETLLQLETAKGTVETLRYDGVKAMEAYNSLTLELEQSRARINLLEELVSKLNTDFIEGRCNSCQNPAGNCKVDREIEENGKVGESKQHESGLISVKSEVTKLQAILESVEVKYHEDQIRSTVEIKGAYELVEQIKSASSQRVAELETELKKTKADIEELKANLMDKETELQGISEENEGLNMRLEKTLSYQREYEHEKELKRSKEDVADLKANLMDKETELQNVSEENEMLKSELKKKETDKGKSSDQIVEELEVARTAEREALMKLGHVMEEAEKSGRRAVRVGEQFEAAQAANAEMEAELRRLKVQSDQWRKAAEAAATILSTGNQGKFVERTGSLDSNYTPITGKIGSPYSEDMDDDSLKKKNGNMLKKIGVLWKKPQK